MQRKKGAGEGDGRGWGTSKTRRDPDESRGNRSPSISWHAKGRPSRGIYPPGVSWVSPDEALGEGDPHARKGRARRGFGRAGSVLKNYYFSTKELLKNY